MAAFSQTLYTLKSVANIEIQQPTIQQYAAEITKNANTKVQEAFCNNEDRGKHKTKLDLQLQLMEYLIDLCERHPSPKSLLGYLQ